MNHCAKYHVLSDRDGNENRMPALMLSSAMTYFRENRTTCRDTVVTARDTMT